MTYFSVVWAGSWESPHKSLPQCHSVQERTVDFWWGVSPSRPPAWWMQQWDSHLLPRIRKLVPAHRQWREATVQIGVGFEEIIACYLGSSCTSYSVMTHNAVFLLESFLVYINIYCIQLKDTKAVNEILLSEVWFAKLHLSEGVKPILQGVMHGNMNYIFIL